MKRGYSILTRKIEGIDVHVWLTMLIIIIISGWTLVYKIYQNANCKVFETYVLDDSGSSTNSLYVNETIFFEANASGSVKWDFGDGTREDGKHAKHTFLSAGEQTVTVALNGACSQLITLNIHKNPVREEDPLDLHPISGPETALAGKKVTFEYVGTKKPRFLEWSIVNSNDYPLKHDNKVTYFFPIEGNQIVQLQLDNDPTKIYKKLVVVLATHNDNQDYNRPLPPPVQSQKQQPAAVAAKTDTQVKPSQSTEPVSKPLDKPAESISKTPFKTDAWYEEQFEEVIAGHKTAEVFQNYLCDGSGGLETTVRVGNKVETVLSICKKFYKSKCEITSFQIVRDNNNCVTRFDIKYNEHKGFLKKILGSKN